MARLFWLMFMLSIGFAILAGASWAAAYNGLGTLLGAPPPRMGTQSTSFLWQGLPQKAGQRVWRFAFAGTSIPGTPNVRIYVSPIGRVVWTEPADLPDRLRTFHNTGY